MITDFIDPWLLLGIWTINILVFYRWFWQDEPLRHHYGHYPTGHFLIGLVASAPIFFMLGWWMGVSSQ